MSNTSTVLIKIFGVNLNADKIYLKFMDNFNQISNWHKYFTGNI